MFWPPSPLTTWQNLQSKIRMSNRKVHTNNVTRPQTFDPSVMFNGGGLLTNISDGAYVSECGVCDMCAL